MARRRSVPANVSDFVATPSPRDPGLDEIEEPANSFRFVGGRSVKLST
jgi:hypothetical protein